MKSKVPWPPSLAVLLLILVRSEALGEVNNSTTHNEVQTSSEDEIYFHDDISPLIRGRSYGEKQRYDGWYNNLAHPSWGSIESQLTRKTPASYADGVYKLNGNSRPSPRVLSEAFMKGVDGLASLKNRTSLQTFFGQLVSAEILMASELGCPIEMAKIEIEKCDEMYDSDCKGPAFMPFHRAYYDRRTGQSPNSPREQLNRMTSWIDGSFVYSTKEAWVNSMRSFKKGLLKTEGHAVFGLPMRNKDRVPMENRPAPHVLRMLDPERMFILGDPRVNQNPGFLALGIVFYRWHNYQALKIGKTHPDWSDEDIFQAARRRVIATLQNVIMYEYLPAFLGTEIPPYESYKPDVHPGISHVFQSAAFRFGHSTIPPGIYRRDRKCNYKKTPSGGPAMRLCSTWWDSQDGIDEKAVEEILLGLSSQISEREDAILCSDVRNKLFGPMEFSRRDLAALNIMRGRDNGLADYNMVRKCNGFPPITTFEEINPPLAAEQPGLFARLRELYGGDVNNVDLYVGGMLESVDGPGPLFAKIIRDEFLRIRDADRFWFENQEHSVLPPAEVEAIRGISLAEIISAVTGLAPEVDLQPSVFFWAAGDPCPQPSQLNASTLEPCPFLRGYDYFQGSEVPYIYACILLCFIPLLTGGGAYGVIKLMNSRRRALKTLREESARGGKAAGPRESFPVKEWLHQNARRLVKVRFGPTEEEALCLLNRKGEKLRSLSLKGLSNLVVEVTQDSDRPMALIRVQRDYDLVLEFNGPSERKRFLGKLEGHLSGQKKTLETLGTFRESMLANAETKERRKMRLEHFFREAYALTFGLKPGEKRKLEDVTSDVIMVMRTSLSKKEFATALGMREGDVFVTKMFNIVDKDQDGRISFQEFLDTIVLFSKGRTDDKLRIIFDMCDDDKNGLMDKKELSELLNSLVDIAKTQKLSEENVGDLINSMFHSAGFQDKDSLSYEDFKTMMKDFKGDFLAIGLDCKGAKQNYLDATTNVARMQSFGLEAIAERRKSPLRRRWEALTNFLEENRQHIFFLFTFFVITIALFVERFIFYAFMSEHLDLRHIMGVGIAITRGSAASLSFCYSLLLLSMCRNLITKMKEHSLHQYIPLDSHLQFHKIAACTALFFTVLHSIGHLVNFYHVATQPSEHLSCLTAEFAFTSDFRPNISFWLFKTLTGLTGILLYVVVSIIFVFAHPLVRKRAFNYFWISHQLYVFLYVLSLLHGLSRLTGPPRFWMFFILPGIIYTLDKIATFRTRYMALDILETELLPSDVIKVKFYRPPNMKVLSGQWIRVSCTALTPEEFHSFTLTSAPHEDFLSIHVKAQGPYTWRLRNLFDPSLNGKTEEKDEDPPKIRIEGPFGGGNQDWYKFEIAVMVGGGIGVTPYASILNDLVFGTSTNRYSGVACKKVYFLWICPSHRYFEWFIDVLRDVERKDVTDVLEMHIFITQFFHKFDLRTTMLYICENHFQRLQKRSMFTGLKAINHFGRPDMPAFLKFVQKKHSYVSKVGVFSCGPGPLTNSINNACEAVNRMRKLPYFIHHYENFG